MQRSLFLALGLIAGWGTVVRADLTVPVHNSLSGAPATLYLDFVGDNTATWDSYSPGVTPAYDVDGNTGSFSPQEIANINEIWSRVAEKYSPFDINVTTVDPGSYNDYLAYRVVIGGNGSWLGVIAGGVSPRIGLSNNGAFVTSEPNTSYVFPANLDNGDPKIVAEATAHEAGHGFGLQHQSVYQTTSAGFHFKSLEYNPGTTGKVPIMGVSYNSARGLWWFGTSTSYSHYQDDMVLLAATGPGTNGFGYRPDDHPNSADAVGPNDALTVASDLSFTGQGVIEQTTDQDWFSLTTDGGFTTIHVDVAPFGPMLNASFDLFDPLGNLVAAEATSSLGEQWSGWLGAGTYKLDVLSAGNYGDVGQYFISGTLVPEPGMSLAAMLLLGAWAGMRRKRIVHSHEKMAGQF